MGSWRGLLTVHASSGPGCELHYWLHYWQETREWPPLLRSSRGGHRRWPERPPNQL